MLIIMDGISDNLMRTIFAVMENGGKTMDELKPCPFCGGEAKLKKGFPSRQIAHCRQAVVQCKTCGCRTVTFKQLPMEKWQNVDKQAIEAWNRRENDA